jgi:acyl carrier protein
MPDDKLAALEALEQQSDLRGRRAIVASFALMAAAILGTIVLVAYSTITVNNLRAQTKKELDEVATLRAERTKLERETAAFKQEIETLRPAVENYRALVSQDSTTAIEARGETPTTSNPDVQPRIYLQVVDAGDRDYAATIGRALAKQYSYAVPGVEYVPRASRLRNTEVRYYKKDDEPDARRLVENLIALQVRSPSLLYLNLENAKVRPRHYEVWFAAGSGASIPPSVIKVIVDQLGVEPGDVTWNATLTADLGADSQDSMELVRALQDEFRITIPGDAARKFIRVSDVVEYLRSRKALK